ncbi:MAG TPA: sporulation integral membrane protein YtvI [Clostridiales bacterium]|nr:sporulation integral membrane protein YtvI [Clostridiales bacterium]
MFNEKFIKSLKNFLIFLLLYTAVFILVSKTMSYTFPFIAAFCIAFLMQPVTRFFKEKLKLNKNIPSLLSSALVFLVLFVLVTLLFYKIIVEAKQLLLNIPNINMELIMEPIRKIINDIGLYFKDIDPDFIEKNSRQISEIISNILSVLGKTLNSFLTVALSIPMWITVIFIVILSTYFFSRDMAAIKARAVSIFSEKGRDKFILVWYEGVKMLSHYIKAYLFIYTLTFIQTLAGFSILRIKYAVILSIVCAVADVLPVLGIGIIYLPLSAIYFIAGNYVAAIGIIILYIIISVVRQIVEPKIVSTSLGIHPVIALATIFIGLKAYGFLGMIYFTFLMIFYKILKTAKVL